MPTALQIPRSCTRSLICRTTVLTTPSAVATASSKTSVPVRMTAYGKGDPVVSRCPVEKPSGRSAPILCA